MVGVPLITPADVAVTPAEAGDAPRIVAVTARGGERTGVGGVDRAVGQGAGAHTQGGESDLEGERLTGADFSGVSHRHSDVGRAAGCWGACNRAIGKAQAVRQSRNRERIGRHAAGSADWGRVRHTHLPVRKRRGDGKSRGVHDDGESLGSHWLSGDTIGDRNRKSVSARCGRGSRRACRRSSMSRREAVHCPRCNCKAVRRQYSRT